MQITNNYLLTFFLFIILLSCNDKSTDESNKNLIIVNKQNNNLQIDTPRVSDDPTLIDSEFPGGKEAMKSFIKKYLLKTAKTLINRGTVYVGFNVKIDGSISNVIIIQGLEDCKACDEEALIIIKSMPHWNPAYEIVENNKKIYYEDKRVVEIEF